jgi:GT2 family glycosyltransferase
MRKTINKTVIIIITYNGAKWINRCLQSCEGHDVVVVDNSSTDKTLEIIENKFPVVTVLKQKKNLGFGAANNLGIAHALNHGADSVFLLNQDAYLFTDTIELLEGTYLVDKSYGVLSPVHLDATKTKMDRNFSYYLSYDQNDSFHSDCFFKVLDGVYDVPFVNAAGWFIPKATLQKVGGFDPLFFHYGEDDNYCQRLGYHNLKIGVVSNSLMIHDRANRLMPEVKPFSNEELSLELRSIKIVFANINDDKGVIRLQNKIKTFKIIYYKQLMKFNFGKAKYYKKLLYCLVDLKIEIEKSREINTIVGKHYI